MMRLSAALTACALLAGCAPAYYGPGPGPGPYAGGYYYDYGAYPTGAVAYDGFYDGHYGGFYGGYWARDGYFYYADRNRGFHRDFGGHFRRGASAGYRPFHGGSRGGGGGHPGGPPHRYSPSATQS